MPTTVKPKRKRVTRSISFEKTLLAHAKLLAKREKRSVNWIINDLVRKDIEANT